nr:hypothetical protein [Tanacetum cinerariifolium]
RARGLAYAKPVDYGGRRGQPHGGPAPRRHALDLGRQFAGPARPRGGQRGRPSGPGP